jgi:hypothetical protein
LPEYRKPDYRLSSGMEELKEKFNGRRFVDLDPPQFLDYPGPLVMAGARPDPITELGIQLRRKRETL